MAWALELLEPALFSGHIWCHDSNECSANTIVTSNSRHHCWLAQDMAAPSNAPPMSDDEAMDDGQGGGPPNECGTPT